MDQIEQLLRYALRIKDETLIAQIKKEASIRHIAKGNHWARRGDALPGVTFLISGMFRFYFLDSKGREHVDCFCGEFGYPVMPAIDFNVILFPQPEGPRMPKCLFFNSKSTSKSNSLSSFWIFTFNILLLIILPRKHKNRIININYKFN